MNQNQNRISLTSLSMEQRRDTPLRPLSRRKRARDAAAKSAQENNGSDADQLEALQRDDSTLINDTDQLETAPPNGSSHTEQTALPRHGKRFICACDIGTRGSTFTVADLLHPNNEWISPPASTYGPSLRQKDLSIILYNDLSAEAVPEKYGWEAYAAMWDPATARRCVSSFKLHLYDDAPDWEVEKQPFEVVTDFLKHVVTQVAELLGEDWDSKKVLWVLTVPGILDTSERIYVVRNFVLRTSTALAAEHALMHMRTAATQAGLKTFVFLPEQEAALYHIIREERISGTHFEDGENVCVVDAGGGTVDIGTYTIAFGEDGDWTAEEYTRSVGELSGGDKIDANLNNFMRKAVGTKQWKAFRCGPSFSSFMSDWMNAKQRFDGSTMVTMTPFVELIGPLGSDTRPSCRQIAYGSTTALRICFSIEDMQEILNPVVESICARILEQKVATDFRKLYPVGGLVKLTYYRNKLLDVFGNSVRLLQRTPIDLFVVKGAAQYGISPDRVVHRIVKKTIGIVMYIHHLKKDIRLADSTDADANGAPDTNEPNTIYHKKNKRWYVKCFVPIVQVGQRVRINESYSCPETIRPTYKEDMGAYIFLMSTTESVPKTTPVSLLKQQMCDAPVKYAVNFIESQAKRMSVRLQFDLADIIVWVGATGGGELQRTYSVNV